MSLIKPTVFIGLGSTGAQTLGYLKEMIFEEYNTLDFPVIRMLSFISARGDISYLQGLHDKDSVAHITVPNTAVIRSELQNAATDDQKALKSWVPDELFNTPGFTDGSSNFRVAGRLHLWQNYSDIRHKITQAVLGATRLESRDTANLELHERLTGERVQPKEAYVDSGLNIFIVGTLAGGTCSGMVPEFGNIIRHSPQIASMRQQSDEAVKIIGVFSIPNAAQASQTGFETYACNSFAALNELNYMYSRSAQKDTLYLPDGTEIEAGDGPYDYLYLLSPSTMCGDSLASSSKEFDHDALLEMAAMSLFMDVFGGTYATKEGMRDNYKSASSRSGDSRLLPDSKGRKPRIFLSFGAASISMPKYRLGRAAAADISATVIGEWLSSQVDTSRVDTHVKEFINEVQNKLIPKLTARQGTKSVEEEVSAICRQFQGLNMMSAGRLQQELKRFPGKDEPLEERFKAPEGDYYRYVDNQYKNEVKAAYKESVERFFNTLRKDQHLSMPGVIEALSLAQEKLEKGRKQLSNTASERTFQLTRLMPFIDYLKSLEHNFFLSSIFIKNKALAERKKQIMELYERQAQQAVRVLRAEFALKVVTNLVDELEAYKRRMNGIIDKLRFCHDPDAKSKKEITKIAADIRKSLISPPKNMRYLYPRGSAEKEIESLIENFNIDQARALIIEGILGDEENNLDNLDDLIIGLELNELVNRMLMRLVRVLMGDMRSMNVLQESLNQWTAEYSNLVSFACPYIEMDSHYTAGGNRLIPPGGQMWSTVFAPANNENEIKDGLLPKLPTINGGSWRALSLEKSANRMLFYCEEPYFSTTFMSAVPNFKSVYKRQATTQSSVGQPSRYWTSKQWVKTDGPDPESADREDKMRFLLESTLEICRAERKLSGDEKTPCELEASIFKWHNDDSLDSHYFELPGTRERSSIRVTVGNERDYEFAAENSVARDFMPHLDETIKDTFLDLGLERLQELWEKWTDDVSRLRSEKMRDDNWKESDEEAFREDEKNRRIYLSYLKKTIWNIDLQEDEEKAFRSKPWLFV